MCNVLLTQLETIFVNRGLCRAPHDPRFPKIVSRDGYRRRFNAIDTLGPSLLELERVETASAERVMAALVENRPLVVSCPCGEGA